MDLVSELLDARFNRRPVPRPSSRVADFDLARAYDTAIAVETALTGRGWRTVGRKLGFTNRATWQQFDLDTPIWASIYDATVVEAATGHASVSIASCLAPRIEPEIVVGLGSAQSGGHEVAWVAPGFEIVDCHFDVGWVFNAPDIVADFGAHAMLVIGPKVAVDGIEPTQLAQALAAVEVELMCNDTTIDHGIGRNALDGPMYAIDDLHQTLAQQPHARPLAGGEIITTGTLTSIPAIKPGERWRADFNGAGLGTLHLNLH